MESLVRDVRLALRNMRRTPAFSALVIGILAVGLGSSIIVFSLVKGILLDPLGFPRPDELVFLQETTARGSQSIAYLNFKDWSRRQDSFQHLGAYAWRTMNLTGEGDPERLSVVRAGAAVFDALDVAPRLGRAFGPEDDRLGADPVVVLSHRFWARRFGGSDETLGSTVVLDEKPYTVIGVMPPGFAFPAFSTDLDVDLWVPIDLFSDEWNMSHRADHPGIRAVARLRDDVGIEAARADLSAIATALEREYPETNSGSGVEIRPLRERVVGSARPTLLILSAAVSFMLLIVVVNTGGLLLVRATARRHELAIRAALGAGRGRLLRHVLIEGSVLGLLGGTSGLGLAAVGLALVGRFAGSGLPRLGEVTLDAGVVAVGLGLSLLSGLLLGSVPGLTVVRGDLRSGLQLHRSAVGGDQGRLRDVLVVVEVVIAVILLVGAGLTARSLARMLGDDPGVRTGGVLTAQLSLPSSRYEEPGASLPFFEPLIAELQSSPGVTAAGTVWPLPLSGNTWGRWYHVEGEPAADPADIPVAGFGQVSPQSFEALGIPLLRGRGFTDADDADGPPVAIVDERFVERWWPDENPVGKRFKLGTADSDTPWHQVVGVVPNVRFLGVASRTREQIWVPVRQQPNRYQAVVLRTTGDPAALVPALRRAVADRDPRLPVFAVRTMSDFHAATADRERTMAVLVGAFALVGQLLAAVGLYGVLAFDVARRRREIGVRMALGARMADVMRLVVSQGGRLILAGLAVGLPLGYGAARWLASQLYGVAATDPTTLLGVGGLVLTAGMVAAALPSWRAARVDPMESLRQD